MPLKEENRHLYQPLPFDLARGLSGGSGSFYTDVFFFAKQPSWRAGTLLPHKRLATSVSGRITVKAPDPRETSLGRAARLPTPGHSHAQGQAEGYSPQGLALPGAEPQPQASGRTEDAPRGWDSVPFLPHKPFSAARSPTPYIHRAWLLPELAEQPPHGRQRGPPGHREATEAPHGGTGEAGVFTEHCSPVSRSSGEYKNNHSPKLPCQEVRAQTGNVPAPNRQLGAWGGLQGGLPHEARATGPRHGTDREGRWSEYSHRGLGQHL